MNKLFFLSLFILITSSCTLNRSINEVNSIVSDSTVNFKLIISNNNIFNEFNISKYNYFSFVNLNYYMDVKHDSLFKFSKKNNSSNSIGIYLDKSSNSRYNFGFVDNLVYKSKGSDSLVYFFYDRERDFITLCFPSNYYGCIKKEKNDFVYSFVSYYKRKIKYRYLRDCSNVKEKVFVFSENKKYLECVKHIIGNDTIIDFDKLYLFSVFEDCKNSTQSNVSNLPISNMLETNDSLNNLDEFLIIDDDELIKD